MASKAFSLGARLEDIMRAADWSAESTFKTFYYKPIVDIASIVVLNRNNEDLDIRGSLGLFSVGFLVPFFYVVLGFHLDPVI
ncbi:hypothetical protein NDU88_000628, partial [Pleurodeles waltl]